MDRYQFSLKSKDNEKKFRKINSTIYPKIEIDDSDLYVYSVEGDTLWNLADKYFNDVTMWWIIAHANQIGKNSMNIQPGIQLRIPQNISTILNNLRKINQER